MIKTCEKPKADKTGHTDPCAVRGNPQHATYRDINVMTYTTQLCMQSRF